jgi:hypothetical protein
VFFSRGYDFRDHQFQYVDPAYHLGLGGSWWRPHDYVQGLRSWVYPGFLSMVFRGIAALGIEDPEAMMTATRFVHGLLGLVPLAALWLLLVRWKAIARPQPLLLFAAMSLPGLLRRSTRGADVRRRTRDHLHLPVSWTGNSLAVSGIFLAFRSLAVGTHSRARACWRRSWVVGGGGQHELRSRCHATFQGLADFFTGSFRTACSTRLKTFSRGQRRYGEEPLVLPSFVGLFCPSFPFLSSGLDALSKDFLSFASAFYLLMHHLVAHKALRFVLAALVLLLIAYASDLLDREGSDSKLRAMHRALFVGVHALALVVVSFWYPNRGPVAAALALSQRSDFVDRLLIVDGEERPRRALLSEAPAIDVRWSRAEPVLVDTANPARIASLYSAVRELDSLPPPYEMERVAIS